LVEFRVRSMDSASVSNLYPSARAPLPSPLLALDCDQLLPILSWPRHKIHHIPRKLFGAMPTPELSSLSLKYVARNFWKSARFDYAGFSRIREDYAYSLRRFLRPGQRDRGFAGQDAESECFLEVEPYEGIGMAEVADRNILPNVQFEVAPSRG
jgi:hypothetical protein